MRRLATLSASMATVMAITSIDLIGFASSAAARGDGGGASRSLSAPGFANVLAASNNRNRTDFRKRIIVPKAKPVVRIAPKFVPKAMPKQTFLPKQPFKHVPKYVPKGSVKSQPFQQQLVRRQLPLLKPVAANGQFKARLALPPNVLPKHTLIKAPKVAILPKFQPFVQRHWKTAFFWVAVAGIGYLTIPEYYYDRWLSYVDEDDPDYDRALYLLSLASLDEEDNVVRVSKPADVPYRYTATVPPPVAQTSDTTDPEKKAVAAADSPQPVCTLKPFVDRQWAQSFVWVQIPEVGNVTVPEANYEEFVGALSAAPPSYDTACAVLAQAAAADTVTTAQATSGVN
ncbi:MAG: hypothetical protein NW223_24460 [Hyphomicrobiaceae bacterium]|nr:hypothetical protein [Hyphomicrobiaceae bacterium]